MDEGEATILTEEEAEIERKRLEKEAAAKERAARANVCSEKIQQILAEYNCKFLVYMTHGTDGSISSEVRIVSR